MVRQLAANNVLLKKQIYHAYSHRAVTGISASVTDSVSIRTPLHNGSSYTSTYRYTAMETRLHVLLSRSGDIRYSRDGPLYVLFLTLYQHIHLIEYQDSFHISAAIDNL